jgi:hypothetical protein
MSMPFTRNYNIIPVEESLQVAGNISLPGWGVWARDTTPMPKRGREVETQ